MSRELHSRRRQGSYSPAGPLSIGDPSKFPRLRESSSSASTGHDYGSVGFDEIGKLDVFSADTTVDNTRITMTTRVAVRDKTPHRFQVVPLRDVSKLSANSASRPGNSLSTPSTPKKYTLRPVSDNPRTPSKDRSRQSSQSAVDRAPKERHDGADHELTTNKAPVTVSITSAVVSSRSRPSISSLPPSERDMILTEWDLNRERKRSTVRTSQQTRMSANRISHKSSSMSIDSIHKLVHSESPLTQTISRSLQCRTPSDGNHPKSTSLSDIQLSESSSLMKSKAIQGKSRTVSAADFRRPDKVVAEEDSYYALLDAYETSDSMKSNKRHAIYTPSLYVPCFEQSGQPRRTDGALSNHAKSRLDFHSSDPSLKVQDARDPKQDPSFGVESDITVCQAHFKPKLTLDEDHSDNSSSMNSLLADVQSQALKHKSSSRSLPLRLPRGLNYSKPSRSLKCTGTADDSRPGEILYPQIIVGLFADIDKAIEEWSH